MKAPVKCVKCKVGLHEECYYTYHEITEGVIQDLTYETNLVRRRSQVPEEVAKEIVQVPPETGLA